MAELLDPRLAVPPLPPRHISRPRLLAVLNETEDVPLVLLSAGPGAGKTVMLTDWVRRRQAPVAWLTITAANASPRKFWPLLWSALRSCRAPGKRLPNGMPRGDAADLVRSLLDGMSGAPDPAALVIDDAHVLTHPDVLDGLDALVRIGHPPRLRLVLAARSDPLLPLHRYRLAGQMRELRAGELAMTPGEVRELLAVHDVTLPRKDIDALLAWTEGWAAGVRLSAMRMEGTEHPARFVSELALGQGSDRDRAR
jgi:LuxR family maltose regulon positive regulatory protein